MWLDSLRDVRLSDCWDAAIVLFAIGVLMLCLAAIGGDIG
jgi:hypothetical protein